MARGRNIGNVYAELSVRDKMTVGMKRAENSLAGFGKKIAAIAVTYASFGAVISGTRKAIMDASDFSEETSKIGVVFQQSSAELIKWSETAADALGQSQTQALKAAGTIGTLFTAMGLGSGEAAAMSRRIVELGSDLASFNNTSPEDAVLALSAALRGESEPIRRYGVLLDDATLKAKALEMGLYKGVGSLKPATRALAAYEVILSQTKTAQGDFARTSDGLANTQRILAARFDDISAQVGREFLPVMQDLANSLKEIDFAEITSNAIDFAKAIGWAADQMGELVKQSAFGKTLGFFGKGAEMGIGAIASLNPETGTALDPMYLGGGGFAAAPSTGPDAMPTTDNTREWWQSLERIINRIPPGKWNNTGIA